MGIKKFRPMTPGTRTRSILDNEVVTRKGPEKSLTESLSSSGGRNHHGRITTRRRGGGHKRRYRIIDFKRNKFDVPGTVAHIEYDPNRSANIALIHYADGEKRYIIHPKGLNVGDTVSAGPTAGAGTPAVGARNANRTRLPTTWPSSPANPPAVRWITPIPRPTHGAASGPRPMISATSRLPAM